MLPGRLHFAAHILQQFVRPQQPTLDLLDLQKRPDKKVVLQHFRFGRAVRQHSDVCCDFDPERPPVPVLCATSASQGLLLTSASHVRQQV